jgi:hypothetical protein
MTRKRKRNKSVYLPHPHRQDTQQDLTMHSHPLANLFPLRQDHSVPKIPTPQRLFGVFTELVLFGTLGVGGVGWGWAGFESCFEEWSERRGVEREERSERKVGQLC